MTTQDGAVINDHSSSARVPSETSTDRQPGSALDTVSKGELQDLYTPRCSRRPFYQAPSGVQEHTGYRTTQETYALDGCADFNSVLCCRQEMWEDEITPKYLRPTSRTPLDPVPELPIYQGYICSECDDNSSDGIYCAINKKGIRDHFASRHNKETSSFVVYVEQHLQTLFRRPNELKYFPVLDVNSSSSHSTSEEAAALTQECPPLPATGSSVVANEQSRSTSPISNNITLEDVDTLLGLMEDKERSAEPAKHDRIDVNFGWSNILNKLGLPSQEAGQLISLTRSDVVVQGEECDDDEEDDGGADDQGNREFIHIVVIIEPATNDQLN